MSRVFSVLTGSFFNLLSRANPSNDSSGRGSSLHSSPSHNNEKRLISNKLGKESSLYEEKLRRSFSKIKEEFNEHLFAINQNTNEIQSNYEYLTAIEEKMDKLAERIDEISMFLGMHLVKNIRQLSSAKLTRREQEVFILIYEHEIPISIHELSERTGLRAELIEGYVNNLLDKGVPVFVKMLGGETHFFLDSEFKRLQAKRNILKISEAFKMNLQAKSR